MTVQEGRTGFVVDGRSDAQIVDAVTQILADPDRAAEMGSAGRAWVTENWRWDTHAAKLSKLLSA